MAEYLIYRLYGIMASWGDIAVGEVRPTFDHPSKSAVFGMLAASLGIRRTEEERLVELDRSYHFAVRLDTPGSLLRDYHTIQVPPSKDGRRKLVFATRKEEMAWNKKETILSSRDYRCDAIATVCLWPAVKKPPYTLEELSDALNNPVFVPYLGRKSCPLSLPAGATVISAEHPGKIFEIPFLQGDEFLNAIGRDGEMRVFWEGSEDIGVTPIHSITRRDELVSRKRWQYRSRSEHYGFVRLSEEG